MVTGLWSVYAPESGASLARNPSSETNTTYWTAVGAGTTIAQSMAHATHGFYSLKVSAAALATAGVTQQTATGLAGAAASYVTVSADVWVESQTCRVSFTLNYTVGSLTSSVTTYSTLAQWNHYSASLQVEAGKTLDSVTVAFYGTNGSASVFYVDSLQIEQKSYETSYMDGDQPGCQWTGTPHGSTSTRSAQYRGGGRLRNVVEYCDTAAGTFFEQGAVGVGLPPLSISESGYATLSGGQYQGSKADIREFTLVFLSTGTNQTRHNARTKLRELFDPLVVSPSQPIRLRYLGNTSGDLEIEAVYVGGLEWQPESGASEESIPIRLRAQNPWFYETTQDSTTSASHERKTLSMVLTETSGIFANLSATLGTTGTVYCLLATADYLYIGGDFTDVGDANGDYIVRYSWSTGAISSMGTGLQGGICYCLYEDAPGSIVAGGAFTTAGGVLNTSRIARWNGTAWTALGTGANAGIVYAIDGYSPLPIFYAGGSFATMGGAANTKCLAYWDGSAWSAATDGTATANGALGPDVRAIAVDKVNLILYVSGYFSAIDAVTCSNLAYSSITGWSAMGTGLNADGVAWALAVGDDGTLYLAGETIVDCNGVTGELFSWNGSDFTLLSSTFTGTTYHARWWDGELWLTGNISADPGGRYANDAQFACLAFNGSAWRQMPTYLPSTTCRDIVRWGNKRYLALTGSDTVWSSIRLTVTNTGTAKAYPRFYWPFSSGATLPAPKCVVNETTGERVDFYHELATNYWFALDLDHQADPLDKGTVPGRKYAYDPLGSAMYLLKAGSELATFGLAPGSNDLTLFVAEAKAETTATNVGITWRIPHAGVDK